MAGTAQRFQEQQDGCTEKKQVQRTAEEVSGHHTGAPPGQ
jgi:hypothetical protein